MSGVGATGWLSDGFRTLGCEAIADLAERALAVYRQEWDMHQLLRQEQTWGEFKTAMRLSDLPSFDDPFYDRLDELKAAWVKYIRANAEAFTRDAR